MDEGHAAEITRRIRPRQVTVLNVLEDQLDRFIDPELVRNKLGEVAARATDAVILNTDDQNILVMNQKYQPSSVTWFGIASEIVSNTAHGLGAAETYLSVLPRQEVSSEITSVDGLEASAVVQGTDCSLILPNRGLHFALDAIAALESARRYLGESFDLALATKTLNELPPVFARGEIVKINGEEVEFILVQNPMSFQLNLDNLTTNPEQIFLAIGRDVHDPSWLWTVDLKNLSHVDVLSGFNFAEMGLRLTYADIPVGFATDDLQSALDKFFALPRPEHGRKTVIFSADAMRRTRRMLGLTDPEAVER